MTSSSLVGVHGSRYPPVPDILATESRAIGRYLARKYGKGQLLADESNMQSQAIFDQGASVEMADFEPAVSGILWEKVFGP